MLTLPQLMESIDESFKYIRWDWETKEILLRCDLLVQSASYLVEELGMVAAIVGHIVFVGTSSGHVRSFVPRVGATQGEILIDDGKCWDKVGDVPVALETAELQGKKYMLVVKKTKAVLYKVSLGNELIHCLIELCGITLNSSIIEEGMTGGKLYSQTFTAAYMIPIKPTSANAEKKDNEEKKDLVSEESKTTMDKSKATLSETTIHLGENLDHIELGKPKKKKTSLMIYLADSNAFLHVYTVGYLNSY